MQHLYPKHNNIAFIHEQGGGTQREREGGEEFIWFFILTSHTIDCCLLGKSCPSCNPQPEAGKYHMVFTFVLPLGIESLFYYL